MVNKQDSQLLLKISAKEGYCILMTPVLAPKLWTISFNSLIFILKNMSERTEPCGIPQNKSYPADAALGGNSVSVSDKTKISEPSERLCH